MKVKILIFCMTVLLLLTSVTTAAAAEFDPRKTGSISVTLTEQDEKMPVAGAELSLYCIATVGINTDGKLNYRYTGAFAGTDIPIEDPDLAAKLDAYLSEKEVAAAKLYTNTEGTAVSENLPLGLYLIRQTGTVEGFAPCTPFLVTVPMEEAGAYVYAVNASPKTYVTKLVSITIRKICNTNGGAKAADSVTVQLLRNGNLVQTATLSEKNNWKITYTDMPKSDAYRIQEVNIPKGFTATYKEKDFVFTVTNTATLAQTGQPVWPIPVLALTGVLLIAAGFVLLQKKREPNA